MISTPTFESFEPPTRTFSIQSLSTNVIYIEIGCNKVNTKNENIFNFIDDSTVSSMFRTAKTRLFQSKYMPYFIFGAVKLVELSVY